MARQAVVGDRLPGRGVGDERAVARPHAGVAVKRRHPDVQPREVVGVAAEEVTSADRRRSLSRRRRQRGATRSPRRRGARTWRCRCAPGRRPPCRCVAGSACSGSSRRRSAARSPRSARRRRGILRSAARTSTQSCARRGRSAPGILDAMPIRPSAVPSPSGAIEIRGAATGLLDEPFELRVRGAGPAAELTWRARYRDDDDRIWRATAARAQELATRWMPAKESTGQLAALRSLRALSIEVRVETADGRGAARTLTRQLVADGVRVRRWRDGLAATLHVPARPQPCATVIVDATGGLGGRRRRRTRRPAARVARGARARRRAVARHRRPARARPRAPGGRPGGERADPAAAGARPVRRRARRGSRPTARGRRRAAGRRRPVPAQRGKGPPPGEGVAPPSGGGVVLPPGVGARDGGPHVAAARHAEWDALLARLGATPRAISPLP